MFSLPKVHRLFLPLLLLTLTSCAGPQPIKLADWSAGLKTEWIQIKEFNLLLLEQPAKNHSSHNNSNAIHIYIEGDGTPWVKRFLVARDPTPRYPLALELMKRDSQLSFYLGRPCYYQESDHQESYYRESNLQKKVFQQTDFYKTLGQSTNSSPCNSHYWTDARYSADVVDLMKEAIQQKIKKLPNDKQTLPIILIGHSGGGTLAMLIAQQLQMVSGVITVAANMDIDAWTSHKNYSSLDRSINIAKTSSLRKIPQVHFFGSRDEVVPATINQPFLQKIGKSATVIEGFDHNCCWLDKWPKLLLDAEQQLKSQK
ncbi:MAG: hypothetical protein V4732_17820 [Pseudomonadota bacterium]